MEQQFEIISKVEAAMLQLGDAIELYYKERYVSAITLAGAAEEIFSRLGSELLGGNTRMDNADITASMMAMFDPDHVYMDSLGEKEREVVFAQSKKMHLQEHNRVRNELKHKTKSDENFSVADSFLQVARTHISNAICNIIISRTELPFKEPLIDKFCSTVGLSNPYLNKENWQGGS